MRVPWASDWLSVHLAAVFLSSSPVERLQTSSGGIKGEAFVTRSVMNTPLKAKPVLELEGCKVNGNGDELRKTACAATARTPTEPPRGERLCGPQARLAVLASAARSDRQGAEGKGGLEGEGLPSVAQRPSRIGEPGTGIPVFASAKMPLSFSTLIENLLSSVENNPQAHMLNYYRRFKELFMAELPLIELVPTGNFTNGSFVFPNSWYSVRGRRADGQFVGRISYGVSPLNDRIYVDGLDVEAEFIRNGYAKSMLLAVAVQCSPADSLLPITALHETWSSQGFWNKLRNGAIPGLAVTQDLRVSEMDEEAKRWRRQT